MLAGVPVSYNIDDAGRLLDELGVSGKILDQTRRVVRGTQNWVAHILDNADPQEDTLHVAVDSRDFFVTLTPLRAKRQAQAPVKQWRRAAKPPPRSEDHDLPAQRDPGRERSWAQVVRNQESQKAPPAQSSESHARLALLERTVATLIGLLKEVGQELPPSVQGVLNSLEHQDHARLRPVPPPRKGRAYDNETGNDDSQEDAGDDDDDEDATYGEDYVDENRIQDDLLNSDFEDEDEGGRRTAAQETSFGPNQPQSCLAMVGTRASCFHTRHVDKGESGWQLHVESCGLESSQRME